MLTSLILFASLSTATIASIAVFVAVTTVAWLVIGRVSGDDKPTAETRLDALRTRSSSVAELSDTDKSRKKNEALAAVLEKATSPLEKTVTGNEKEMSQLREKLVNAGFRRETAPVVFKGLQLILAGVGLFLGGAVGLLTDGFNQGMLMKLAGGVVAGFALPSLALGHLGKKRKEKIFLGLPDALDLMVVCVEAGLGMDQALRKVAEEMEKSHKTIGEEFGIANQQLQFGRTRSEVLQALGFRSGVDDLKQLASILIQADKFGSSVANALRVQSDSMRIKRRQIAEEKAAKTAVKMIFPLVLFIFPGIFVVLVGPAGINMYRNMLEK
ncbi:Bacterial type II secretion system protein F domain protein [Rubripirellula lacrimiformis]|uniref:Bacterial type II secretion system protein F domain protein n=1 Tax=Rubripirellula lacrimiformis TaxID=1930273 RepID=A0A517NJD4_9BACT|nr:type II secretion system F family protein [Rubripirellula lacrimiformis]QDT07133.1 Bacterial type II secretion system protein F domain protein [Rubripirellula lacrimiformis]